MSTIQDVRPAAVAGAFYPGQAGELRQWIQVMIHHVPDLKPWTGTLKAVIVPHAGYVYSGPVAASAFAGLDQLRGIFNRIVLLGPTHHVRVSGMALPGVQAFETPLGRIPIDLEAVRLLARFPQITTNSAAHAQEHSLEVQLPFLQETLGEFRLVPLAVGEASPEEVAEVLEALWGGPETLLVVSSDLSHYLPYEQAQQLDQATCAHIVALQPLKSHDQACGATPVNGLLLAARTHHLKPHLLDLRNSGDTSGDRRRVVGYAAFAFTQDAP